MDVSGGWVPDVPNQGALAHSAWREDGGIEGTVYPPDWNPGPGFGTDGGSAEDWTVATVAARELGRRIARFFAIGALAGLAGLAGLITLAVVAFQQGGTLAALVVLLGVPALLVTGHRHGALGQPSGVAPRDLAGGRAARAGHALAGPGDLGVARRPGGPGVLADRTAGAPALASAACR